MSEDGDDTSDERESERPRRRAPVPAELRREFLSGAIPAVPGRLREEPEDFVVEELPLYEPSGEGEHLYLWIEKRGIPTHEAIRRIAQRTNVPKRAIGYAGLKDARAVTRQWLSLQHADPALVERIDDEQLRVLVAKPHKNKLKIGHLRGNRFRLLIAGGGPGEADARAALTLLSERGVPNLFGLQRFGWERHTHLLGEALVREQAERVVELVLLGPEGSTLDHGRVLEAREAVRAGDHARAERAFPGRCSAERAICRALAKGEDHERAVRAIPPKMRDLYLSAFQSLLFNRYLAARLERLDVLEEGEIATKHRNGASFLVEDVDAEQPRCAAQEISPSGPIFGRKLLRPREGSAPYALEEAVLAEHAPGLPVCLSEGRALGVRPQGARRPLRIPLGEVEVEREGDDLRVAFSLPKGCYATAVIEELFKEQVD